MAVLVASQAVFAAVSHGETPANQSWPAVLLSGGGKAESRSAKSCSELQIRQPGVGATSIR